MGLSEQEIIALFAALAQGRSEGFQLLTGVGDDAAVVRLPDPPAERRYVLTSDMLVEGVHFDLRYMSLADVGWKALAVNLSDLAAMGARPMLCLGNLGVPHDASASDVELLRSSIAELQQHLADAGYSCPLIGGDTCASPQWTVGIFALGYCDYPPLLRNGARPGDGIYLSSSLPDFSSLGLADLGWRELYATRGVPAEIAKAERESPFAVAAQRHPNARLDLGLRLAAEGIASSCIDTSDSLSQSLLHIAQASGVGLDVDLLSLALHPEQEQWVLDLMADKDFLEPVKRNAWLLTCAEDYELLFTVPPECAAALVGWNVTRIGTVTEPERGCWYLEEYGERHELKPTGYQHLG